MPRLVWNRLVQYLYPHCIQKLVDNIYDPNTVNIQKPDIQKLEPLEIQTRRLQEIELIVYVIEFPDCLKYKKVFLLYKTS
jgi:hypothetical protein